VLIDLHNHTRVYSPCSALTPEALVRAAQARGVDGVCLTEHDAAWPRSEIEQLTAEMDFLVLRGMEVTTEVGHVLVFGLDGYSIAMATLSELHRIVAGEGALMYLAHPSRRYGTLPPDELGMYFDGVEVCNGTEGMLQNDNAARLAAGLRLPGIGGSDAHAVREAAICATEFEGAIGGEDEFLAALRSGEYRARRV
jgi:predicted metal-dependent phosphoesterase TrpH